MNKIFSGKNILITGHTGFKGSWLSVWLKELGANIIGLSNDVPTNPAHYNLIKSFFFQDHTVNIKESDLVYEVINNIQPEIIFHMAAQPIVLESYQDPLNTFSTNAIGSANILDAIRRSNHKCNAIMITSDKCYDNLEWPYGYRETDRLGGKDPYSGSKGAAEMVIRSYVESFFKTAESNTRVAIGRAGNVIGGGDWAPYRIVPDCVRAWSKNDKIEIRNPNASRPWQHVLEPISGYISLAVALNNDLNLNGEAFNFGPNSDQNFTVEKMVKELIAHWPNSEWAQLSADYNKHKEAGLLKLNCDKALHILNWQATLDFKETTKWTAEWYLNYYQNGPESALEFTVRQINEYMNLANKRGSLNFS